MTNPTADQTAAIQTTGRALLVEAGAGTGKTWVLVERFVYLLDQNPTWPLDSIFAMTFTEKAAREMRTRIRAAVELRAARSPQDPAWQERRRELDRLQISTIHGLCARILRENAIAAGIDPYFEVIDERQTAQLHEQAIEETLADLANSPDSPHAAALDLLVTMQVRDLREQMAKLLKKRATVERLFGALPPAPTLLERWRGGVTAMRQTLWEDHLENTPGFSETLEALAGRTIHDPEDKLTPALELAQRGIELIRQGRIAEACAAWKQISRRGGKGSAWGGPDGVKELSEQLGCVQALGKDWAQKGYTAEIGAVDEQAAAALQCWQALWQALTLHYSNLKKARSVLDFDDLELHASRLLAQQPRSARLQAFLDGICHLMVDEFQDTNLAQKEIVYALAQPQSGRLFVVGDVKQSIYRFRQAQVTVFNQTARDIQAVTACPPIVLGTSFRTHQALLSALNSLFASILRPLGRQYQDYEARPGALQPQRHAPLGEAALDLLLLPQTDPTGIKINAEDCRIFEARLLAENLLNLHAREFPIWDSKTSAYRPFRFSDAAILFRSTTSLALYEEQFKAAGLPYLTISGRGYFDRPEIRDLTALLACLYNPADDLNLAAALRSPLFNLSDETLYTLRWHAPTEPAGWQKSPHPLSLRQALRTPPPTSQPAQLAFAAAVLTELWDMTGRTQVWQLLRTALDRSGYEATLALNDLENKAGGRQRSNIVKLLDMARQESGSSLSEFLRGLENLRANEAREGEALANTPESGSVQLMSIHVAKGLEFGVVAVADLGREKSHPGGPPRLLHDPEYGLVCMLRDENGDWTSPASYTWANWLNKRMEAAEDKRLLYVACTRAADRLILSGRAEKETWMEDLINAWQIPPAGQAEETLARDGFTVHIERPDYRTADDAQSRQNTAPAPLDLADMPAFALPVPVGTPARSIPVTHLERLLSGEEQPESEDASELIRPAVRGGPAQPGRVPAYLIGRVIHRALAEWDCLALPVAELARRIEEDARSEGISSPTAVAFTLQRSGRILEDLRRSPLYPAICAARQRWSEVPFTLTSPLGVLHGVIDLLYQGADGEWHLIDWKSEWVPPAQLEARAAQHCLQIAIYAEAARAALGQRPHAALCFLAAGARTWSYTAANLAEALQTVFLKKRTE